MGIAVVGAGLGGLTVAAALPMRLLRDVTAPPEDKPPVKRPKTEREKAVEEIGPPEWSAVKPRLAAIAGKSISSLIKTQGIGDLYRMYSNAKRDGVAFNAIWVPASFAMKEKEPFDQQYMRALFNVGYETGKNGIPWSQLPPG